jgi:hypothetical protein
MLTFVLECACLSVVLFYFQRSLLWKRSSRALRCGVAAVACALVVLAGLLDDDMHELVEHGVFKNRDLFVHQYIQSAPMRTHVHHEHEPAGVYLFQHVPRTAGDSMEIMLFAEYGRIVQYALPFRYNWENWGTSVGERRARLAARTSNETKVISGFWGREDVAWMQRHMPNRTFTRFTFLRDPRERALSMVSFANIAECEIDPIGVPCSFRWALERVFNASRRDARGHVHFADDPYLETYLVNAQTWMLGDSLFADARNRSLSDDELLARAKRALDEMAFVGFYDDLAADFLGLWRTVFRNVDIPPLFPWLFWLGAFVARPRVEVRKFTQRARSFDARFVPFIERAVSLDQQLYDYAVARFKCGRLPMYDGYFEWAFATLALPLAVLCVACVGGVALMRWRRRRMNRTSLEGARGN